METRVFSAQWQQPSVFLVWYVQAGHRAPPTIESDMWQTQTCDGKSARKMSSVCASNDFLGSAIMVDNSVGTDVDKYGCRFLEVQHVTIGSSAPRAPTSYSMSARIHSCMHQWRFKQILRKVFATPRRQYGVLSLPSRCYGVTIDLDFVKIMQRAYFKHTTWFVVILEYKTTRSGIHLQTTISNASLSTAVEHHICQSWHDCGLSVVKWTERFSTSFNKDLIKRLIKL